MGENFHCKLYKSNVKLAAPPPFSKHVLRLDIIWSLPMLNLHAEIGQVIVATRAQTFPLNPSVATSDVRVSHRTALREPLWIQLLLLKVTKIEWLLQRYKHNITYDSLPHLPEREIPATALAASRQPRHLTTYTPAPQLIHSPEKSMWQSAITANTQQRRRLIERSKVYFPWTLDKLLVCFLPTIEPF